MLAISMTILKVRDTILRCKLDILINADDWQRILLAFNMEREIEKKETYE